MKEIKRVVGLLLCFVMVFGLLPVHALALDFNDDVQAEELVGEFIPGDVHQEILTPDAIRATNAGSGNLPGGTYYVLDRNGVDDDAVYLIVSGNNGNVYALCNNDGSAAAESVTVTDNTITSVGNESQCTWTFNSGWTVQNGSDYLRMSSGLIGDSRTLGVSHEDDGAYYITYGSYYLRYITSSYYGGGWQRNGNAGYVYLFKQTTGEGTSVSFEVTPASKALQPNETLNLESLIKLGNGTEVESSDITWTSSNKAVATVSGGEVTALTDGTTTITATLSKVNGMALVKPIVVEVSITVTTRTVTGGKLLGDNHVTTKQNVEPDFSGIKLHVTYDDGSTAEITTDNGLLISGYDIATIGYSYATVSYNGKEYGTVRVTVEGNPYAGLDEATVYPVYPADGAVRIDKFATELDFASTGLVQVELDVAGVSVKGAVDVILVTDLSNSMAWAAGGRTDASSHEGTKMADLAVSVNTFANIFLADEEDGSATRNTLSLVTFGGYDADYTNKVYTNYADPTQTLVLGTKDAATIKNTVNNIRVLADDALNLGTSSTGYYLSFDGGKTYGENYGNTNYDHAFMQTADAIAALKKAYEDENEGTYAESGRQIFVIFMTDGAPSNYDGVYYNYKTGDRADVNCTWVNANGQEVTYTMGNNRAQYNQADWFKYIAGSAYNATTQTITGNPLYWADQVYNTPGVADIITVGFDLDNGGFSSMLFTEEEGTPLAKVLEKLVTGKTLTVHSADDKAGMEEIYDKLATKLRYAGTQANVADVIDPDFTLQMSSFTGTVGQGIGQVNIAEKGYTPSITIKAYDLYSKSETTDTTLIGTRKGTYQEIETVTFNADGTAATSNKKDGNILRTEEDGTVVIEALYFTFTKTPEGRETFEWEIGNITDKEIALSYFAYLKGSLEGKEPDGLKYTNEGATLDYIDINGKHAQQIFPIPAVAWGGASTSYEFYLVNDSGKPCDRNGNEIPFANRIIITGPYFQELYLNQSDEEIAQEIIAVKVLPAGYTLFDETAKYEVQTASGDNDGYLEINDPGYGMITSDDPYNGPRYDKVTNADGTVSYVASENGAYKKLDVQTTIRVFPEADSEDTSFIQSRVAFGVIYNMIPSESTFVIAPDAVVIDYGKEIIIDVNSNNDKIPSDVTATLIGFSKFYDDIDVKQQFSNTPYSTPFEGTYGTFSITADNKVSYVPHKLVNNVGKIFCVYRLTKGTDAYYMVSELDVIPATVMYYETDFATGVFTTESTWTTKNEGAAADGPQNDGTIGQNTYGFDTTYNNDAYLSNGSSLYAEGAGVNATTATFSFTGTGFDLISRTGAEQGLIKVQVFTDAKMTNVAKTVTVLNKSESSLELYQIPVVSINGLEHGTYYVKIGVDVGYSNTDFAALYRGNQFYFDAIRIYDPAKGNDIAEAAYNADGEANSILTEVRASLISANDFNAQTEGSDGMVYVDSTYTNGNPDHQTGNVAEVADYKKVGPNNEVYLSKGQAIAFEVKANSIPASFDIGAKSITGSTAGLSVTVTNSTKSWTVTQQIASSTVQFIDLLNTTGADASQLYKGAYVVITNTGEGVLSITDLKTAFRVSAASVADMDEIRGGNELSVMSLSAAADPFAVSYTVDASTLDVARMVLCGAQEPEIPEIPETPVQPGVDTSDYAILDATLKVVGSKKNQKCTFTVVTKQSVESIEIAQNSDELIPTSITYKDKKNGIRTWTIVLTSGDYDSHSFFVVTGVGEDGVRGQSVSVHNIKSR